MRFATLFVLLTFAAPLHADYFYKSTDQFGFVGADIGPEFRVTTMCTVSNGEIDKLAEYVDWIPSIGDVLAKAMDVTALNKGVSACGLRHTRKQGAAIKSAKSNGFELTLKTYKDGTNIGTDAPDAFCRKVPVNLSSLCFEFVKLNENASGEEADGVTACIDVKPTNAVAAHSIVLGAGTVPQQIKDDMAVEANAVQPVSCDQRSF